MAVDVVAIRTSLRMTQVQLARLLGVHGLTVSKWERGVSRPIPHQEALLTAAAEAAAREPDIGMVITIALATDGVAKALFLLLRATYTVPVARIPAKGG